MSSGWLLSAISTGREKNRCMAVNRYVKKQESEVSLKVIWAGVLVGSVSGQQLRTCSNCLAAWLFLQQSHLSVFMCKQRTLICPVFHTCAFIQCSYLCCCSIPAPLDLSTNVSGKCRWMQPPVKKLFFFHCDWCVDSNPIPVLLLDHQSRLEDCWKYVLIPKVLQFSAGPVQAETNWFLHSTKQW